MSRKQELNERAARIGADAAGRQFSIDARNIARREATNAFEQGYRAAMRDARKAFNSCDQYQAEYLATGGMFNPELANHDAVRDLLIDARDELMRAEPLLAVPMLLWCPQCNARHIDQGEFATKLHHTHACQDCGMVWRPAIVATVGVQYLPGFKDRGAIV